jgi:hypothetical protein
MEEVVSKISLLKIVHKKHVNSSQILKVRLQLSFKSRGFQFRLCITSRFRPPILDFNMSSGVQLEIYPIELEKKLYSIYLLLPVLLISLMKVLSLTKVSLSMARP